MKSLYLLINFCTVIVPFIFSFHPRLRFYKNWQPFFLACIPVALLFIIWDIFFTAQGVWGFNQEYLLSVYIFNLPIEEILFFICIPFACVFTYHCLNIFFKITWPQKAEHIFVIALAAGLFFIGFYYIDKSYTSYTFISLAAVLLLIKYAAKYKGLPKLFGIYPVLLIPFFIVNGILTGSGIEHPVVWYNNAENLGVRLFTIPVEDIFYGFELILLNVFLYEYFLKKRAGVARESLQ